MAKFSDAFQSYCAFQTQCCGASWKLRSPLHQFGQATGCTQDGRQCAKHFWAGRSDRGNSHVALLDRISGAEKSAHVALHQRLSSVQTTCRMQNYYSCIVMISTLILFLTCRSAASIDATGISMRYTTYSTSSTANAVRREGIDSSLQRYAYMALSHAKTGIFYNVPLTPHFDGITAQVIRLRSGGVKKRGLTFNEFIIPEGALVDGGPVVVLIYRKLLNFTVYSLPEGFDFVGPVVGILPYTASQSSFDNASLTVASLTSPTSPILVHVPISYPVENRIPICAFFYANGSVTFSNVTSLPNVCTPVNLGDVSLVYPSLEAAATPNYAPKNRMEHVFPRKPSKSRKVAVAAIIGTIAGLALLSAIAVLSLRAIEKVKIIIMERFADRHEALQTALIGNTRAPTAAGMRTLPTLETENLK